jgi:hypothetical protein
MLSFLTFALPVDDLTANAAKQIFSDWRIYAFAIAYMGLVCTGYSGSVSSVLVWGVTLFKN